MRLTLRTLLAYMDGLLSPEDAADLAKRIEESDAAAALMHRIREDTKKMRLGAPKVLGRGTGLDPNTVADYLDNTLPPERAPDFEKVCIESDVHLAEVAACHQVLAMVLAGPAEVQPALRRRIYAIPQADPVAALGMRIDEPHAMGADASGSPPEAPLHSPPVEPPAVPQAAVPRRRELEVPDYLRAARRPRWGQRILAVAVAIAAGFLVWSQRERWMSWLDGSNRSVATATNGANGNQASAPSSEVVPVERPEASSPAKPVPSVIESENPLRPTPTDADVGKSESPSTPIPPAPTTPSVTPTTPTPGEKDRPAPPTDIDSKIPDAKPALPSDKDATPPVPDRPRAPKGQVIGRFASDNSILLRRQENNAWVRLPPGSGLAVGDRLLALPGFQPRIVLGAGIQLTLAGGTSIELEGSPVAGAPGLQLVHGKVPRVTSTAAAGQGLWLHIHELAAVLSFEDADTAFSLESTRHYELGADPIEVEGQPVTQLAVLTGRAAWRPDGQDREAELPVGTRRTWLGSKVVAEAPPQQLPGWVDPAKPTLIDERGMADLASALKPGEPAALILNELIASHRVETRSLAARGYANLSRYDALLTGLRDDRDVWKWRVQYIDTLRAAVLRGPDEAARVRDAFIKQYDERGGKELYRMLLGFSPKDLEKGVDAALIDYLSHKDVAFRALAFYNLKAITGVDHGYKPEDTDAVRRTPLQTWKSWLKNGRVVYRTTGKA